MFFTDGINPGAGGFADIFGSDDSADDFQDDNSQEQDPAPRGARSARTAAPPEDNSTAAERVAASLAADLEADGIELPDDPEEPGQDLADQDDLEGLSEDEIREMAREALALKPQISEAKKREITSAIEAAEENATEHIRQRYQTDILAPSAVHYAGEVRQRVATVFRNAIKQADQNGGDPVQFALQAVVNEVEKVWASRQEYENEQAEIYEQHAQRARLAARKSVPALRQVYAEALIAHHKLPQEAMTKILKKESGQDRALDDMAERAQELAGTRDGMVKRVTDSRAQQRTQANRQLSTTGRVAAPAGVKPPKRKAQPPLKGTADEGAALLQLFKR